MRTRTKIPSPRPGIKPLLLCCALLVLATPMSHAANGYTPGTGSSVDFSLQFSRAELDLEADTTIYPADLSRISVSIFEPASSNLDFGLMIGSSYLSLDNDTPSAGLKLNGYHIGLLARSKLGTNPQLRLQAHYLYQYLNDSTPTTEVSVDWHEWQLASKLRFALGQDSGLLLGAGYTDVDADRRVTGSINQTLGMDLEEHAYGLIELEMLFPYDGRVSLTVFGGGQQGLSLDFSRRF